MEAPRSLWNSARLMQVAKYVYIIPFLLRKIYKGPRTFIFRESKYIYFEHPYNRTWKNERSVEIPVVKSWISKYEPSRVLEIGNVLSHYFNVNHTIIDKYERGNRVIADDAADVKLSQKFGCIVSISTLEHVGWDEIPRTAGKHLRAVENLKSFLEPGGKMIVTIPLGYNPPFDNDIFSGKAGFSAAHYLRRINTEEWREAAKGEVENSRYGISYRSTDGLAICEWDA